MKEIGHMFGRSVFVPNNFQKDLEVRLIQNEFIKSSINKKNDPKNLTDFCPKVFTVDRAEILQFNSE